MALRRVLVANRGEIAVRIIRACRELGLETVAVASDADLDAPHARLADRTEYLGPADPLESYLRQERVIEAARRSGADAIHPGYGFLAESAAFADAVAGAGLRFVGPPGPVIAQVGNKTAARAIAERAGVPVIPGFVPGSRSARSERSGENAGDGEAGTFAAAAQRLGYPVLVKAAAGGGGRGMRVVERAEELPEALASGEREARAAFGDGRLYLERQLQDVRHVEVQIVADARGEIAALGERECSVQRRHQKLIEESPSPRVDPRLRADLAAAAVAVAKAAGYVNAGTVEFLIAPGGQFYFLEVNARLQVEHPVTELVAGVDLVKAQLRIATGASLGEAGIPYPEAALRGHALECRICAEDPADGFRPSPGPIVVLDEPTGPGVRVDSGLREGWQVPAAYDSLIAKVIVWDGARAGAVARMAQTLARYVILGCGTNLQFLRDVVAHEAFRRAETPTDFLERHFSGWRPEPSVRALAVGAALADAQPRPGIPSADSTRTMSAELHAAWDPWGSGSGWRIGGPHG